MRLVLLALLFTVLPASAFAVTDSIAIKDTSGSGQTNRPITISRVFASGEFPTGHYPQASVSGAGTVTTQADVKTTWADGSVKHALVSFVIPSISASGTVTVTFVSQNSSNTGTCLSKSAMLAYGAGTWDAQTQVTTAGTASARTMLNALTLSSDPNSTESRTWLCGTVATQVIIEDRSSALAYDMGLKNTRYSPITGFSGINNSTTTLPIYDSTSFTTTETDIIDYEAVCTTGKMGGFGTSTLTVTRSCGQSQNAISCANSTSPTICAVSSTSSFGSIPASVTVNPGINFTARSGGSQGNAIQVILMGGGSLSVSTAGNTVNITIAPGGSSINAVIAACAADTATNALIVATTPGSGTALIPSSSSTTADLTNGGPVMEGVISGGTGNWAAANGSGQTLTIVDGTHISFGFDSSMAGALSGTLNFGAAASHNNQGHPSTVSRPGGDNWVIAPSAQYQSLHPIFVLTFYPTSAISTSIKAEYILENCYMTKWQNQVISFTLTANGSSVFSKANWNQIAGSRWRKEFWLGTAPSGWTDETAPGINIDHNLAYLASTKALPNYDTSMVVSGGAVTSELSDYNTKSGGEEPQFCISIVDNCGSYVYYFGQPGGRGDLGFLERWCVRYLYTFDPTLYPMFVGDSLTSGQIPWHYREADSSLWYDAPTNTVPALGRMLSFNARPTFYVANSADRTAPYYVGLVTNKTAKTTTPDLITTTGWNPDDAHQAAFSYTRYLLEGDWYLLDELYSVAAFDVATMNYCSNDIFCRHADWGFVGPTLEIRGVAWATRNIGFAAFMAPDGSPEQTYYQALLNTQIEVWEGVYNITTGSFPPANPACPSYNPVSNPISKWCFGRFTQSQRAGTAGANPIHIPDQGDYNASGDALAGGGGTASATQPTIGSTTFTVPDGSITGGFAIGFSVRGTGIQNKTIVLNTNDSGSVTTVTLSLPTTGALSSTLVTFVGLDCPPDGCFDFTVATTVPLAHPFESNFMEIVYGFLHDAGFPISAVWQYWADWNINLVEQPMVNAYATQGAYPSPISEAGCTSPGCDVFLQSWSEYASAWNTTTWDPQQIFNLRAPDPEEGYPDIAYAALSFTSGVTSSNTSLSGTSAWNWIVSAIGPTNIAFMNDNPKFAIVPRSSSPPPTPNPGLTVGSRILMGAGIQ